MPCGHAGGTDAKGATAVQIGMIGLGRMGGNMRERLRAAGHEVVGYDPRPDVSDVASLAELAGGCCYEIKLATRKVSRLLIIN